MKTAELNFEPHSSCADGQMAAVFFDNGYGASVITGSVFYTSESAPYELAVLKGSEVESNIAYDTPLTGDVMGYLTEKDVDQALSDIENLPKA